MPLQKTKTLEKYPFADERFAWPFSLVDPTKSGLILKGKINRSGLSCNF